MSVRQPACWFVCLPANVLSVCLPVCLSVCLSACLPAYLSSTCLTTCPLPAFCLYACQPVCLPACACLREISDDVRINNRAHLFISQTYDCVIAVADQHSLKSCGIAIAEVLLSSCGITIADLKKRLRMPTFASNAAEYVREICTC
jgi:hypothetical protein